MNASYNKLVTKHGLYMIGFICSRNLTEMFSALFVWMKLEGFNNKIKVAKRIGYGYRDDDFFFTLIRYLSLPSVRYHPTKNRDEPNISKKRRPIQSLCIGRRYIIKCLTILKRFYLYRADNTYPSAL